MRYRRIDLDTLYPGHWIEFDSTVPLALLESVLEGEHPAEFIVRSVHAWSFDEPVPTEPGSICELLPWDLAEAVTPCFCAAHRLSKKEIQSVLCMIVTGEPCKIHEAGKLAVVDRLKVPYASSYGEIPAGEYLRLREFLNEEAECRDAWKPTG